MVTLYIGSDHAGYELKQEILKYLEAQAYEVRDLGCDNADRCDYPVFGQKVAQAVVEHEGSLGIVLCGSGIGISMAANKVSGARCVLANSIELAQMGRLHNGANILALGARTKNYDDPLEILETFLKGEVDPADRHQRRREQLDAL